MPPYWYYNIVLRQKQLFWLLILLKGHKCCWLEATKQAVGSNPFLSIREQKFLLPSIHLGIRQSPVAPCEPPPTEPAECCGTGSTQQKGSMGRRAAKTLVNILLVDHDRTAAPMIIWSPTLCSRNPSLSPQISAQWFSNTLGAWFGQYKSSTLWLPVRAYYPIMMHTKFLVATCSNKGHLWESLSTNHLLPDTKEKRYTRGTKPEVPTQAALLKTVWLKPGLKQNRLKN